MLKRIQIPPGISRESTQYVATGRWYDANNMRFRGGVPETIGGWSRDSTYILQGIGRRAFSSTDYAGNNYQFAGTSWKYYVIVGTDATDITPIRKSGTLTATNPFTTVATSRLLSVEDAAHGLAVNDWVVFKSMTAALAGETSGGMTEAILEQVHGFQVAEIIDDNNYKLYIVDWSTGDPVGATASATGGGTVTYYYHVASGVSTVVSGQGWGSGLYGGTATPTSYGPLVDDPITGDGTSVTAVVKNNSGTDPDADGYVYLQGIEAGVVEGVELSLLNDNWWPVTAVVGATDFDITTPYTFSAGSTDGGGAAVTFYKADSDGVVTGATRGWGDASALSVEIGNLRRVYIDNYGEDVMFSNSGGPIYYWDTSANAPSGSPLGGELGVVEALSSFTGSSNTPIIVDSFLVSKRDGHCVALGCNDVGVEDGTQNLLLVRWSDQNNPFDWTPTATNTSGGQVLRVGSRIACGVSTKDEVIIFTDAAVYSMRFIGPPAVFSFALVTEGVEIVSPDAAVNAANSVYFMGNDGFYVFTGTVEPLPSPVAKYVFDDFNVDQKGKCFAAVNSAFSEVMWFYPTRGSFECNRYVTFNYEEEVWDIGFFDMAELPESDGGTTSYNRTSWRDAIVFSNPMGTYVYEYDPTTSEVEGSERPVIEKSAVMVHESGTFAQSSEMSAHIESGEVDISDGERLSLYTRMIPDLKVFNGASATSDAVITLELNGRNFPGEAASQLSTTNITVDRGALNTFSTYTPVGNATAVRGRGRSVSMKLSSESGGFQWRIGDVRLDLQPDGRR